METFGEKIGQGLYLQLLRAADALFKTKLTRLYAAELEFKRVDSKADDEPETTLAKLQQFNTMDNVTLRQRKAQAIITLLDKHEDKFEPKTIIAALESIPFLTTEDDHNFQIKINGKLAHQARKLSEQDPVRALQSICKPLAKAYGFQDGGSERIALRILWDDLLSKVIPENPTKAERLLKDIIIFSTRLNESERPAETLPQFRKDLVRNWSVAIDLISEMNFSFALGRCEDVGTDTEAGGEIHKQAAAEAWKKMLERKLNEGHLEETQKIAMRVQAQIRSNEAGDRNEMIMRCFTAGEGRMAPRNGSKLHEAAQDILDQIETHDGQLIRVKDKRRSEVAPSGKHRRGKTLRLRP